jgi:phosphatidylinositol alpha-1,6-mannosyltransferase
MPHPPGPRVLFLTTDYPPDLGGLQTYSHRVATGLPGGLLAGVAVGTEHPASVLSRPSGDAAFYVHAGTRRLAALIWSFRRVPAALLSLKPRALLHMQWSTALPSFLLRKARLGPPYVILIHGAEFLDPGRPLLRRIQSAVFAEAAAVVAGSRATADLFARQGFKARRMEVIHYGNPGACRDPGPPAGKPGALREPGNIGVTSPGAPGEGPRLLCMHRLVPRKGTALLLRALAGLKDMAWSLKVVGRGEEEPALRKLAAELGLGPRVAFEPPVEEAAKADLMDRSDLFLLPSLPPEGNNHMEGLGLTLLEAQGRGLPVLAARTGGIPEAVDEGRTGLLFTAGDANDLRRNLRVLLEDADLRSRLGKAGPAWVRENFDWEKSLGRLAGLLKDVAGRN